MSSRQWRLRRGILDCGEKPGWHVPELAKGLVARKPTPFASSGTCRPLTGPWPHLSWQCVPFFSGFSAAGGDGLAFLLEAIRRGKPQPVAVLVDDVLQDERLGQDPGRPGRGTSDSGWITSTRSPPRLGSSTSVWNSVIIEHLAPAAEAFFILRPGADQVALGETPGRRCGWLSRAARHSAVCSARARVRQKSKLTFDRSRLMSTARFSSCSISLARFLASWRRACGCAAAQFRPAGLPRVPSNPCPRSAAAAVFRFSRPSCCFSLACTCPRLPGICPRPYGPRASSLARFSFSSSSRTPGASASSRSFFLRQNRTILPLGSVAR